MRKIFVIGLLVVGFTPAAASDYAETRELNLDAAGVDSLFIDAGAGSIEVKGDPGLDRIEVVARIIVEDADEERASKKIAKSMTLSLERRDDMARLDAYFRQGFWGGSSGARIDLEVRMPAQVGLEIEDGSGFIDVQGIAAAVSIDDGSGSIDVRDVASVYIDDGSGSIDVNVVAGDVEIDDGSGSIEVRQVGGSVTVDDGSGDIDIRDVEMDVIIIDSGSGGVRLADVRGRVEQDL